MLNNDIKNLKSNWADMFEKVDANDQFKIVLSKKKKARQRQVAKEVENIGT